MNLLVCVVVGIVVGILTQEGHVDLTRMSVIRELTRGMSLTFHRAFDLCIDYKKAIEDVATVGCDRLLTSGQEKYAHLAAATRLKEIVNLVANRYLVVAGSGINADNVRMVISNSRVSAVHIASGANQTVLTNLSIDPILETPLFAMAAEMKVWKCVNESLVNTLAEKAWEAWIEIEHQKDKPQSQQQQH
jgi:copper homeostasis protein CutC